MNFKPIIIVLGEPYSVFAELLFKCLKNKSIKKIKSKIILIGTKKLIQKQMYHLGFNFKVNEINIEKIKNLKLKNKEINIINTDFKFKRAFDKISNKSSKYI